MSPILGIWASQNYPRITNSYESISTVTVGAGGSSSISFSSIPSTYSHIQIRGIARSAGAGINSSITFNSDSGSNYTYHYLLGDGVSAGAGAATSQTSAAFIQVPQSSETANTHAAFVLDILDYKNTSKYKTVRLFQGFDINGAGRSALWSSLWLNTNAITNISIANGANFAQYSSFALYGIRG